ncbi:hypothetical protein [Streptomyces sp. AC512_CC834]|uniref:hypothetical protein n=1 Tax=Streptomyces sp. AC512_CC834 TaxID=2823691 RepID=UPI001C2720EF|nr:hypothetical protein [Streptomyces sp. AC512_CC834]
MVRSDALELERRLRRRSPGRIVLVTLIVVAALILAWRVVVLGALEAHYGSGFDDRRFDKLETGFDQRQTASTRPTPGCGSWWPPTRRPNESPGAWR